MNGPFGLELEVAAQLSQHCERPLVSKLKSAEGRFLGKWKHLPFIEHLLGTGQSCMHRHEFL